MPPGPQHPDRSQNHPRRAPRGRRHLAALPDPAELHPRSGADRKESYTEQQARLAAEAVERWAQIVPHLPPLTEEQIQRLAVILNRIDARLAQLDDTEEDRAA
ncbi:hypothetical protein [Amycolatopsis nigrescens]|uniref:hypothetical protein n=1 Tax=Amycolatopsis nigrescens TaxID=381445 RepID=UPI0012FB193D|nr:hypothetical protein [Amycolatopsis nigrescens]